MPPVQNFTAPEDWTNHDIPGLVCRPSTWVTVASFLFSNFIAHGFTIKKSPHQTIWETVGKALWSLASPFYGIGVAMAALIDSGNIPCRPRKTALQRAHAAGALCMVVRSPSWRPVLGDQLRNVVRSDIVV